MCFVAHSLPCVLFPPLHTKNLLERLPESHVEAIPHIPSCGACPVPRQPRKVRVKSLSSPYSGEALIKSGHNADKRHKAVGTPHPNTRQAAGIQGRKASGSSWRADGVGMTERRSWPWTWGIFESPALGDRGGEGRC